MNANNQNDFHPSDDDHRQSDDLRQSEDDHRHSDDDQDSDPLFSDPTKPTILLSKSYRTHARSRHSFTLNSWYTFLGGYGASSRDISGSVEDLTGNTRKVERGLSLRKFSKSSPDLRHASYQASDGYEFTKQETEEYFRKVDIKTNFENESEHENEGSTRRRENNEDGDRFRFTTETKFANDPKFTLETKWAMETEHKARSWSGTNTQTTKRNTTFVGDTQSEFNLSASTFRELDTTHDKEATTHVQHPGTKQFNVSLTSEAVSKNSKEVFDKGWKTILHSGKAELRKSLESLNSFRQDMNSRETQNVDTFETESLVNADSTALQRSITGEKYKEENTSEISLNTMEYETGTKRDDEMTGLNTDALLKNETWQKISQEVEIVEVGNKNDKQKRQVDNVAGTNKASKVKESDEEVKLKKEPGEEKKENRNKEIEAEEHDDGRYSNKETKNSEWDGEQQHLTEDEVLLIFPDEKIEETCQKNRDTQSQTIHEQRQLLYSSEEWVQSHPETIVTTQDPNNNWLQTNTYEKNVETPKKPTDNSLIKNMMGMFCSLGLKDSPEGGFYHNGNNGERMAASVSNAEHKEERGTEKTSSRNQTMVKQGIKISSTEQTTLKEKEAQTLAYLEQHEKGFTNVPKQMELIDYNNTAEDVKTELVTLHVIPAKQETVEENISDLPSGNMITLEENDKDWMFYQEPPETTLRRSENGRQKKAIECRNTEANIDEGLLLQSRNHHDFLLQIPEDVDENLPRQNEVREFEQRERIVEPNMRGNQAKDLSINAAEVLMDYQEEELKVPHKSTTAETNEQSLQINTSLEINRNKWSDTFIILPRTTNVSRSEMSSGVFNVLVLDSDLIPTSPERKQTLVTLNLFARETGEKYSQEQDIEVSQDGIETNVEREIFWPEKSDSISDILLEAKNEDIGRNSVEEQVVQSNSNNINKKQNDDELNITLDENNPENNPDQEIRDDNLESNHQLETPTCLENDDIEQSIFQMEEPKTSATFMGNVHENTLQYSEVKKTNEPIPQNMKPDDFAKLESDYRTQETIHKVNVEAVNDKRISERLMCFEMDELVDEKITKQEKRRNKPFSELDEVLLPGNEIYETISKEEMRSVQCEMSSELDELFISEEKLQQNEKEEIGYGESSYGLSSKLEEVTWSEFTTTDKTQKLGGQDSSQSENKVDEIFTKMVDERCLQYQYLSQLDKMFKPDYVQEVVPSKVKEHFDKQDYLSETDKYFDSIKTVQHNKQPLAQSTGPGLPTSSAEKSVGATSSLIVLQNSEDIEIVQREKNRNHFSSYEDIGDDDDDDYDDEKVVFDDYGSKVDDYKVGDDDDDHDKVIVDDDDYRGDGKVDVVIDDDYDKIVVDDDDDYYIDDGKVDSDDDHDQVVVDDDYNCNGTVVVVIDDYDYDKIVVDDDDYIGDGKVDSDDNHDQVVVDDDYNCNGKVDIDDDHDNVIDDNHCGDGKVDDDNNDEVVVNDDNYDYGDEAKVDKGKIDDKGEIDDDYNSEIDDNGKVDDDDDDKLDDAMRQCAASPIADDISSIATNYDASAESSSESTQNNTKHQRKEHDDLIDNKEHVPWDITVSYSNPETTKSEFRVLRASYSNIQPDVYQVQTVDNKITISDKNNSPDIQKQIKPKIPEVHTSMEAMSRPNITQSTENNFNINIDVTSNSATLLENGNQYRTTMDIQQNQNEISTSYLLFQRFGKQESPKTYFELKYDMDEWKVGEEITNSTYRDPFVVSYATIEQVNLPQTAPVNLPTIEEATLEEHICNAFSQEELIPTQVPLIPPSTERPIELNPDEISSTKESFVYQLQSTSPQITPQRSTGKLSQKESKLVGSTNPFLSNDQETSLARYRSLPEPCQASENPGEDKNKTASKFESKLLQSPFLPPYMSQLQNEVERSDDDKIIQSPHSPIPPPQPPYSMQATQVSNECKQTRIEISQSPPPPIPTATTTKDSNIFEVQKKEINFLTVHNLPQLFTPAEELSPENILYPPPPPPPPSPQAPPPPQAPPQAPRTISTEELYLNHNLVQKSASPKTPSAALVTKEPYQPSGTIQSAPPKIPSEALDLETKVPYQPPGTIHSQVAAPAPVNRPPVWSFAQSVFHTDGQSKTFFKVIDDRKKSFQSSTFMYRGERVKISRGVNVFKNDVEKQDIRNEQSMYRRVDEDYEGYSEIWDDGNQMTVENEVMPEVDGPVTRSTAVYEMATEEDIFTQQESRNCAWHLNLHGPLGVCKISPGNLDAIAIEDDNTLLGSRGFDSGHHTWIIQGLGIFCAVGVCYPGEAASSWYKGGKWVWTTDGLRYSEPNGIRKSEFGQWRNEDVLKVSLDCENHKLTILNTRTHVEATLHGFTGEVYPYFNIYKGSSIRLLETSME